MGEGFDKNAEFVNRGRLPVTSDNRRKNAVKFSRGE
jgi:hypothetical protein